MINVRESAATVLLVLFVLLLVAVSSSPTVLSFSGHSVVLGAVTGYAAKQYATFIRARYPTGARQGAADLLATGDHLGVPRLRPGRAAFNHAGILVDVKNIIIAVVRSCRHYYA